MKRVGFHHKLKNFTEQSQTDVTFLLEEEKKIRSLFICDSARFPCSVGQGLQRGERTQQDRKQRKTSQIGGHTTMVMIPSNKIEISSPNLIYRSSKR
jgi:hypothetical protein